MADKRYRYKKYTTRTTMATQKDIARIRSSALKKANTAAKKRFIQSQGFEKLIRKNIKQNRIKQNTRNINLITETYAQDPVQRERIAKYFSETTKYRNGKKYRVNSMTSKKQTDKLKKIVNAAKKGKPINIQSWIKRTKRFKEAVANEVIEKEATFDEALEVLYRTDFYIENKELVTQHNKNVDKYGYYEARNRKPGVKLGNKYAGKANKEAEDLATQLLKFNGY